MTGWFVYMTAKDKAEALRIGRAIVEARLAACANVVDGMTSLYWWDGAVQQESEALLVAKTRKSLVGPLIDRVKSLHGYSCPCVVAWPIEQGNADYLKWLHDETAPADVATENGPAVNS